MGSPSTSIVNTESESRSVTFFRLRQNGPGPLRITVAQTDDPSARGVSWGQCVCMETLAVGDGMVPTHPFVNSSNHKRSRQVGTRSILADGGNLRQGSGHRRFAGRGRLVLTMPLTRSEKRIVLSNSCKNRATASHPLRKSKRRRPKPLASISSPDRTAPATITPRGVAAGGAGLAQRPSRSFAIGRLSKRREMSRY